MDIKEAIKYIEEETDMELEDLEEDYNVHIDMVFKDDKGKYKLTNGQGVTMAMSENSLIDFVEKQKGPIIRENKFSRDYEF